VRFLFYSHDGLGLGHTRRHLAVAAALARLAPESGILLATGAEEILRQGLPREVETLKLPGLRKEENERYAARRLCIPAEEIRSLRSDLLLTAVRSFRPGVVLVDKHPFGASGEFRAGLRELRKQGGRAVLGFRDILDEPGQVRKEWAPYRMQHRIAKYYAQVLIYGEKAVFDPVSAYGFPASLEKRTRFCGYVLASESERSLENFAWPFPPRGQRTRPVVLATTGGGEDGFQTLSDFISAAQGAAWQGVVVAGPMTPEADSAALESRAREASVAFRRYVPHLSALFGELDGLVCMGGYNTIVEAVAQGVPTLCVPRVRPRIEQLMRAEAFERLGLLQVCRPELLSPERLRRQIAAIMNRSSTEPGAPSPDALKFDGAERAAEYLLAVAAAPPEGPD